MANYSARRRRRLFGPRIAILAGIIVALLGIYFIFVISANTDKSYETCTEEAIGTVTASEPSGSGYQTTIEYTPGYNPMSVILVTKTRYEPGTEISLKYNPTSFTKVYIEGMSPTGKSDKTQGAIFVLVGILLALAGFFLEKRRKR